MDGYGNHWHQEWDEGEISQDHVFSTVDPSGYFAQVAATSYEPTVYQDVQGGDVGPMQHYQTFPQFFDGPSALSKESHNGASQDPQHHSAAQLTQANHTAVYRSDVEALSPSYQQGNNAFTQSYNASTGAHSMPEEAFSPADEFKRFSNFHGIIWYEDLRPGIKKRYRCAHSYADIEPSILGKKLANAASVVTESCRQNRL
ncbi:hypothetical protein ED733_001333 [Metarhizium rileyi]|uniref:Uncharacterized protein n=1 Tax=Metarhizium rileyi (strain RCEF 4871) TaxID=1649241 RepID=A0A5C6G2R6_METRR|nr:hypothetical protein ED733_001333 [Metarhizium rileyi]